MLHSSSPKYIRWFFYVVPSASMTMGTVLALFFHILPISIAKSLYFSIFSSSFFTTLVSPGTATSMILHSFVQSAHGYVSTFFLSLLFCNLFLKLDLGP